jgi:hypothetical protein
VQFDEKCACASRIPAPLDEACDLENANGAIKPDRQNVADLHGVAGRGLADAIDANTASLHQSCSTAASFDHPRVPQPFIETLALQGSVPRRVLERFRAKHALGLDPGVETGSREENASKQEIRARF